MHQNQRIILYLDHTYGEGNENVKIAKAALEKQIPKKLICIEIEKCCPICKEGICLIGDDGNYGNYFFHCNILLY